jgi:hypothetical protein
LSFFVEENYSEVCMDDLPSDWFLFVDDELGNDATEAKKKLLALVLMAPKLW